MSSNGWWAVSCPRTARAQSSRRSLQISELPVFLDLTFLAKGTTATRMATHTPAQDATKVREHGAAGRPEKVETARLEATGKRLWLVEFVSASAPPGFCGIVGGAPLTWDDPRRSKSQQHQKAEWISKLRPWSVFRLGVAAHSAEVTGSREKVQLSAIDVQRTTQNRRQSDCNATPGAHGSGYQYYNRRSVHQMQRYQDNHCADT